MALSSITASPWPLTHPLSTTLTHTFIGLNLAVHAAWSFSDRGIAFDIYHSLRTRASALPPLRRLLPVLQPRALRRTLDTDFLLLAHRPLDSWRPLLGHAVSHKALSHLLTNLAAFYSASRFVTMYLPPAHYAALLVSAAVVSGTAWLASERVPLPRPLESLRKAHGGSGTQRAVTIKGALGASGVISALFSCAACFAPQARARPVPVPVVMPLWAAAAAYVVLDALMLQRGVETGVGHASHLGGAAWGVAFYLVAGRPFAMPWSWMGDGLILRVGGWEGLALLGRDGGPGGWMVVRGSGWSEGGLYDR